MGRLMWHPERKPNYNKLNNQNIIRLFILNDKRTILAAVEEAE